MLTQPNPTTLRPRVTKQPPASGPSPAPRHTSCNGVWHAKLSSFTKNVFHGRLVRRAREGYVEGQVKQRGPFTAGGVLRLPRFETMEPQTARAVEKRAIAHFSRASNARRGIVAHAMGVEFAATHTPLPRRAHKRSCDCYCSTRRMAACGAPARLLFRRFTFSRFVISALLLGARAA